MPNQDTSYRFKLRFIHTQSYLATMNNIQHHLEHYLQEFPCHLQMTTTHFLDNTMFVFKGTTQLDTPISYHFMFTDNHFLSDQMRVFTGLVRDLILSAKRLY